MIKESSYSYSFKNGTITITRGITTRFDWSVSVSLNNDKEGNKRFICLDQKLFLTRKNAKKTTSLLLNKYGLL